MRPLRLVCGVLLLTWSAILFAQRNAIRDTYSKTEVMVPMRDGVKLYTGIYAPKDTSKTYPILMIRTPYGSGPYGPDAYKGSLGPARAFAEDGYIFVYQDVRGRYMSEGHHIYCVPHIPNKTGNQVDESSDAYDTIEYLIRNVPNHSGKVGIYGVSQPGFYATHSLIDAHPALKAVSPQAPVTDRFEGDDDHRGGAFSLAQRFSFQLGFGAPRPEPTATPGRTTFRMPHNDLYKFHLEMGPLPNYLPIFKDNLYWEETTRAADYNEYWQVRNVRPHLKNIKPAVLVVGGLFDAEDLFGAWQTYLTIEKQSPGTDNRIVMGPWSHGGWHGPAERLGPIEFGSRTGDAFVEEVERPFFAHHLHGKDAPKLPEAMVFDTGVNKWSNFDVWPPRLSQETSLYLQPRGRVGMGKADSGVAEFVSDPADPVPFIGRTVSGVPSSFMIEDQRFASARSDVLTFRTEPLEADMTLAGPISAELYVSITGTDADWIVKVIDEYPSDAPTNTKVTPPVELANYQMLVRWDCLRGKYRESLSHPKPFVPGETTLVRVPLQGLFHTFKKGHRLVVQIQSSMFPLLDRNPQTFTDIYQAKPEHFVKATHRVHLGGATASRLVVRTL